MEIDFWFDFSSPYCYPVAMTIEEAARYKGLRVNWRGFMLAPIIRSQSNEQVLNEQNHARQSYIWHDMHKTEILAMKRSLLIVSLWPVRIR